MAGAVTSDLRGRARHWDGRAITKRRAGIGPRREARAKTRRALLRPKTWLLGLGATALVLITVSGIRAAEQAWFDYTVSPLLNGFMLGAGLISVPWALWTFAVSGDGSSSWRIGADAEQWTAKELHRLGPSWHIEHSVPFPENGYQVDVDHIAVGPHGVVVAETKFTSASVDLGAKHAHKEVRKAVEQAEKNAGRVRGLLSRVADIDVIPLVVFWGRDVTATVKPFRRDGEVRIVAGKEAARWRPLLGGQRFDAETVARSSARVHEWLVKQEEKTSGVVVRLRLQNARRLGRSSAAVTASLIALFPAARAWADLDRVLGAVFRWGGGAVGAASFFAPLVLALSALGFVHAARREDPTISFTKGMTPLVFWCAAVGALLLATP